MQNTFQILLLVGFPTTFGVTWHDLFRRYDSRFQYSTWNTPRKKKVVGWSMGLLKYSSRTSLQKLKDTHGLNPLYHAYYKTNGFLWRFWVLPLKNQKTATESIIYWPLGKIQRYNSHKKVGRLKPWLCDLSTERIWSFVFLHNPNERQETTETNLNCYPYFYGKPSPCH